MRLLLSRLPAYVAVASVVCHLSIFAASAAAATDEIVVPDADTQTAISDQHFESLNNGKKPHPKKKKYSKRILNLVCDGLVIDKLVCKIKKPCAKPALEESALEEPASEEPTLDEPASEEPTLDEPTLEDAPQEVFQAPVGALNNGGGVNVTQVYIIMDKPCSKDLPPLCAAAIEQAAEEEAEKQQGSISNDGSDTDDNTENETDPDADADVGTDEDAVPNTDDTDLWFKKHHKQGKHHRHRHNRHHHHKNPHHNKRPHPKKNKHPYKDLCVAVGEFCGDNLYGCNFEFTTRYLCKAVGEKPIVVQRNAKSCGGTDDGKCKCPISKDGKPVCGSNLPADCGFEPNAIYHCPNGAGSDPVILKKCLPGTKCKTDKDGNANCGYDTCECTGYVVACSEQYPTECKLVPNSIYKCDAGGAPVLVKTCSSAEECVSLIDDAYCANKDCKCPTTGKVCGIIFPLSCRLSATTIYTCTKGQSPIPLKDCLPGYCTSKAAVVLAADVFADAQCINDCMCVGTGKVCGSTFSLKCKLEPERIYQCDGENTAPKPLELCPDKCIVQAGGAICSNTNNKCKCPISKSGKPVCGSSLPADCGFETNAIYHCPNGAGSDPVILEKCLPGRRCQTDDNGDPHCGYDTCECSGNVVACSDLYPTKCNLIPNSIYKCDATGVPVLVKTCSSAEECVSLIDGAQCVNKDCKCPVTRKVCGNIFPRSCKLSTTAIYTCTKGQDPVLFKECAPGYCSSKIATTDAASIFADDQCIYDCKCVSTGKVCGSTFSAKCKLEPERIYQCDGEGTDPKPLEKCPDKCIVQAGGAICSDTSTVCKCPINRSGKPVCGSILPPECNFEPNAIYHCPNGAGSDPVILKRCLPGTKCKMDKDGNANCGYDTCECNGEVVACSKQFPTECNFVPNSIYKCPASGVPELVKTCSTYEECVSVADGAYCANKDCKCPTTGKVCGSIFPDSCKLSASTIYDCKKGEPPVPLKNCEPGTCSAKIATAQAAGVFTDAQCINECMCVGTGK
ncbi:hypothetical protein BGZ83_002416, partial [Gryganskiella cystojenkinii]